MLLERENLLLPILMLLKGLPPKTFTVVESVVCVLSGIQILQLILTVPGRERKREQEPSYAPDASAIELSELHHVTREPAGRS